MGTDKTWVQMFYFDSKTNCASIMRCTSLFLESLYWQDVVWLRGL